MEISKTRGLIAILLSIILCFGGVQSAFASQVGSWVQNNGAWKYEYADGGCATSSWEKVSGQWYYFDASGVMVTGWQKIDGAWYYFNAEGVMAKGWQKVSGQWYYLNDFGEMVTGWCKVSGSWYFLRADGTMATGWQKVGSQWYYLDSLGVMASSRWVGDYYVGGDGVMATNCWIGNYYVGSDGKWVRGKTKPSSQTSVPQTRIVYCVPNGTVYHLSKGCPTLKRSKVIYSGTIAQSGKSRVCSDCG